LRVKILGNERKEEEDIQLVSESSGRTVETD
jgi:hypothetical protein